MSEITGIAACLPPLVGSIATLKSGGPLMTVARVYMEGDVFFVDTTWFDDAYLHRGKFVAATLNYRGL